MSSVDSTAAQNALFEKLAISRGIDPSREGNGALGQSDFLKLMTTQLQNQDPFEPMDNGDFIAQMAQFSTVTGITEVNESLSGISGKFDQASYLFSQSCIVIYCTTFLASIESSNQSCINVH